MYSGTHVCICPLVCPGTRMHFWKGTQEAASGAGQRGCNREGGGLCNFLLGILCHVLRLPVQMLNKNQREIETEEVRDKGTGKMGRKKGSFILFNPEGPKLLSMPLVVQEKALSCPPSPDRRPGLYLLLHLIPQPKQHTAPAFSWSNHLSSRVPFLGSDLVELTDHPEDRG